MPLRANPPGDGRADEALPGGEPAAARRAWWATAAVALALAAAHFALLLSWLVPGAAVPLAARRVANAWVAPVFVQNWWLFAPDPPPVDRRVDVRGIYRAGGRPRTTPWLPLTGTTTRATQRNPLSSRHASWIVVLNATYAIAAPGGPLSLRGPARELLVASWSDPTRQPPALVVLERAGSRALSEAHPGLALDEVQVRLTVRPLPRFAERDEPTPGPADVIVFPPVPFAAELAARGSGW